MEKVLVIGLGYVGLPLACTCAKKGFEVTGVDIDQNKVRLISEGISPIEDELLRKEVKETYSKIKVYSEISEGAEDADIVIICVPTPVKENKKPDLKPLQNALEGISKVLRKNQLIIIESTIYPGLTEEFAKPILEKSGLKAGKDFQLVHCPERINPGDTKWKLENIPRVVGGLSREGTKKAADFYRKIIDAEILEMSSAKEAEATKILENTFRDINIAFINELAKSFDMMGINVYEVIRGAATKPFSFMPHYPGPGVGGHCIPVDPYYQIEKAKQNGFKHSFLILAREINESMPLYVVEKTVEALRDIGKGIKNANLAVLGLAYKKNIDDTRESPSLKIIAELKKRGANVKTFDPHVKKSDAKNLGDALKDADCVILVTDHDEFKKITPNKLKSYNIKAIVDTRKLYNREEFENVGIIYKGIGY